MNWRDDAACDGAAETFTPDHSDPTKVRELARRYCTECPTRQACGEFADQHSYAGLWGGAFRYRAGGSGRYQWEPLTVGDHIPVKGRQRSGAATRWAA